MLYTSLAAVLINLAVCSALEWFGASQYSMQNAVLPLAFEACTVQGPEGFMQLFFCCWSKPPTESHARQIYFHLVLCGCMCSTAKQYQLIADRYPHNFRTMATALRPASSDANEVEVRWEDQQKINKFGALTNARDELKDQIAYCKVCLHASGQYVTIGVRLCCHAEGCRD